MGTASSHLSERRKKRPPRILWLALALVLLVVPTLPTIAASPVVRITNLPGFGDYQNSFAWSMAWFKGSLYVGTVRNEDCLEFATFAYYNIAPYNPHPQPEINCGASIFDLDLRAEIWKYTPTSTSSGSWRRVYQSPVIPNPEAPGKSIAMFVGFRGMVVYTSKSGEQSLFVGSVTPDEFVPELRDTNTPRLLRTTDGEHFTILNGAPDRIYTVYNPTQGEKPIGYRSMIEYGGRLFVTASSGLAGDGVIEEVGQPMSDNPTFTQVSPAGTQVYEMAVFNNQLYVGTGDKDNGYGVMRTDAIGPAPFHFTSVVANGAGRGQEITSVVSMHVFDNRLYVGASGWYNTIFPPSEMIRIAPDNSWEVVVGNPRNTPEGYKYPISGLPDGFGNVFNAHFWRMDELNHGLYVGTNDWSWLLHSIPILNSLLSWQYGFDIYGTCDGQSWFLVTQDAFGHGLFNFGARTMLSTPFGGFIGSANHVQGTFVFSTTGTEGVPQCAPYSVSDFWNTPFGSVIKNQNGTRTIRLRNPSNKTEFFIPSAPASRPDLLQADVQSGGTVLSWNPAQGATQYQVQRATYIPESEANVPAPQKPLIDVPNDLPILGLSTNTSGLHGQNENILGDFVNLGTTSDPYFIDTTAKPGVKYAYTVRAVGGSNEVSPDSNVIVVPSTSPSVTFGAVIDAINALVQKGQLSQSTADSLISALNSAQAQNDQGNVQQSVQTLGSVAGQVAPGNGAIADNVYAQDLATKISSLQRRIALANIAGSETGTPIDNGGSQGTQPPTNSGSPTPPSSGGTPTPTPTVTPVPTPSSPWGSLSNPLFPYGFPSLRNAW